MPQTNRLSLGVLDMDGDKYPSTPFKSNEGYCVHYPSNIFRNTRSFENWGIFNNYPAKSRGISSDT